MPRRQRPARTSRSEHWLREAVNCHSDLLNVRIARAFGWNESTCINWVSPIKADGYAEYYDDSFLDRLRVSHLATPLRQFWPPGGPRWDALARTNNDQLILVEAKAHIEECVDFRSRATSQPLKLIRKALNQSKIAYRARKDAEWGSPFYQYANRLAHLHFLAGLNRQDAYLVFLYFANAPDVPSAPCPEEWRGAAKLAKKCLGLGRHPYSRRIADIILDVKEINRG